MKRQIIIIVSIAEVSDQILELVSMFMYKHNINESYKITIYEELIAQAIYLLAGSSVNQQHNFVNDFTNLAMEDIGAETIALLKPAIVNNITIPSKVKVMVGYKEIVIIKST